MDKHMENERNIDALCEGYLEAENIDSAAKKKRSWKTIRTWMYTAIAIMLIMSATMGSTWAYFTSYAKAKGGVTLKLGHQEEVDEDLNQWEKVINLTSTADSNEVYLRVRSFCAEYEVSYGNSQNWKDGGDGWMYYTKTLAPGASLSQSGDELKAKIKDVPDVHSEGVEVGDVFNVIVVYESMEVQYDADGNKLSAMEADWSRELETSRTITTLGGDE